MDKCDKHPYKAAVGICAYCVTELLLGFRAQDEEQMNQTDEEFDNEWKSALSDEEGFERCDRNSFELDDEYNGESFRSVISGNDERQFESTESKSHQATTLNTSSNPASTIPQSEKEKGHHSFLLSFLCWRTTKEKTMKSFSRNSVECPNSEKHDTGNSSICISSDNDMAMKSQISRRGASLRQMFEREALQSTSSLSNFMKDASMDAHRKGEKHNKSRKRLKILLPSNRVERGSMLKVFLTPLPAGMLTKRKRHKRH